MYRAVPLFTMNRMRIKSASGDVLMGIALVSVSMLHAQQLLLFRLNSYSQIFSSGDYGVALKHLLYFFIPAMLVVYFLCARIAKRGCFSSSAR